MSHGNFRVQAIFQEFCPHSLHFSVNSANIVGMYAVIDIETTGGNTLSDKITEIAIVLHDGKQVVDEYSSLVDPERRIPYRISSITGITNEVVANAPKFYEIARKVVEMTDGCILVAHNAKFDYGFIKNEFKSLGFEFKRQVLCTLELSRNLMPGLKSYNLARICNAIGIEAITFHRALADAQSTGKLLARLLEISQNKATTVPNQAQMSRLNPDANLKKDQIDKLPKETGVYYFYDEHHHLIYVGKSVDIRSRVISHFNNHTNTKALDMKANIAHIRYSVTGSELVALLKESDEIKRHKPLYNRAQRRSRYNIGLFSYYDEAGYLRFRVERIQKGDMQPVSAFSSTLEARSFVERMVEIHQLCQIHTGLQKGKGPCFHHSIHRCVGACMGKEPAVAYNERAKLVLERLQYAGSNLMIIDRGRNENEKSLILIENGKYAGFGFVENEFIDNEISVLKQCVQSYADNKDVRQIINLYLRQGKPEQVITFG
jgi:DNA polymerase III subunit epsilon